MEYLGVPVFKRHAKAVSTFFNRKRKGNVREVHLPARLHARTHARTPPAAIFLKLYSLLLQERQLTPAACAIDAFRLPTDSTPFSQLRSKASSAMFL